MIHSHPVHATMFAIAHQDIPACIDEFAMYVGGDVRCTEYAPSGSAEVGEQAVKALEGRGAALIANHGLVAVGPDPGAALHITALVERSARITWGARALGPLHPLPDESTTGSPATTPTCARTRTSGPGRQLGGRRRSARPRLVRLAACRRLSAGR